MRAYEPFAVLLAGLVLAVAWTWPLAREADRSLSHDPARSTVETAGQHAWVWKLWRAREAAERGEPAYFAREVFHPEGHSLLTEGHPLLWARLTAPLQRWRGTPFALNALILFLFASGFAAAWLLARWLELGPWAAAVAALGWSFAPAAVHGALEDPYAVGGPLPPLFLLLFLRWMRTRFGMVRERRWGSALGAGAVFGLQALASVQGAFLLLVCALVLAAMAPATAEDERVAPRGGLLDPIALFWFVAAAGLAAWPLARELAGGRELFLTFGAHGDVPRMGPGSLLLPADLHPWLGLAFDKEVELHPGLALVALAGFAAWRVPRARRWALVALVLLPAPWWRVVPPGAAWSLVLLPAAIAAGMGFQALCAAPRRRIAAALGVWMLFELWVGPWTTFEVAHPQAVERIAELPRDDGGSRGGAVCTLTHAWGPHVASTWQTRHERPALFGPFAEPDGERLLRWSRTAPDLFDLVTGRRVPDPAAVALDLQLAGVDHVLLPDADRPDHDAIVLLLDDMESWERAATTDEVGWWYRTSLAEEVRLAAAKDD